MRQRRLVTSLALVWLIGCGASGEATQRDRRPDETISVGEEDSTRLAHAHRIDDEATFHQLAARPENQIVARTEVVKFLIDLQDDRRIWFIDTTRWDIHFHFARQFLSTDERPVQGGYEGHRHFNRFEYRSPDRRFVCGSLVHYLDADQWAFEMIAGDNLPGERVLRAFRQVQGAVYFGEQLRYRPISALHEEQIASVADRLPTIGAAEVFRGIHYQPLTQGVAFGTLRIVRGALDQASVRPDQIIVLEQLPDEIPVASGVISQQLQAPLGHLAILCATRGTPNAGLRGAITDERLVALDGQIVRLQIGGQDLEIRPATREEAERAWALRRPEQPLTPAIDRTEQSLQELCSLDYQDTATVGAKAAQLGEACQIGGPIVTPGGFAIPFFHYLRHLESAGVARGLPQMLADGAFRADAHVREQNLGQLRAAIERTPVDRRLMRSLRSRLDAFPGSPRVIFRSSTNAEDLPGFTGAGLYRSIVVGANASDDDIANALREVWASVWLQGAYEEREWYRIDHREVAMGVLVQPFIDGAVANGVAITANPFYAGRPGYFVNVQALGGSVTGAAGEEIPEQHIIYTYGEQLETELISRSSRNGGAPLLRPEEILELAEVLRVLHEHFTPRWGDRIGRIPEGSAAEIAADVEFLIAGPNRDVIVLQARPFVVVYSEGQM